MSDRELIEFAEEREVAGRGPPVTYPGAEWEEIRLVSAAGMIAASRP